MVASQTIARKSKPEMPVDFDAVVIGAGVSGLYQLHKLRELGLTVRVFEAGTGVGGTWYWNRYPGARFDSESWTYGYSFSQELLDEWDWEEHFAGQPETERYLNHVADRFDLRRDIQFKSRVASAHYREDTRSWDLTLEDGRRYAARFLVTAVGVLSAATLPNIPGVKSFQGPSFHTHYWPKAPVSFAGKRVAVIGTGATGIQTITEVAKTAGATRPASWSLRPACCRRRRCRTFLGSKVSRARRSTRITGQRSRSVSSADRRPARRW